MYYVITPPGVIYSYDARGRVAPKGGGNCKSAGGVIIDL